VTPELPIRQSRHRAARAFALLSVLVMVCVPSLARMGQKLETASHAPSFRNIECPPKKVTVTTATAVASPIPINLFETMPVSRFVPPSATAFPRSPHVSAPRSLRAPPSPVLA
jgi:hypothetical protein